MANGNDIMLEMQFGLGRDIPASPFSLEFGDELACCCHPSSIAGLTCQAHQFFLLALISIASPVAGFQPIRAGSCPHMHDAEADDGRHRCLRLSACKASLIDLNRLARPTTGCITNPSTCRHSRHHNRCDGAPA